jgi:hypothetical protein
MKVTYKLLVNNIYTLEHIVTEGKLGGLACVYICRRLDSRCSFCSDGGSGGSSTCMIFASWILVHDLFAEFWRQTSLPLSLHDSFSQVARFLHPSHPFLWYMEFILFWTDFWNYILYSISDYYWLLVLIIGDYHRFASLFPRQTLLK